MGAAVISNNTWIHRIAAEAVKPLVHTPVTPNHLTTLRLATGVAAAACFLPGDESWNYAGAGAFVVSMLLDRADGELARLSGRTSITGHRYDMIADALCNALALFAIGVGVQGGAIGEWSVACGIVAGTSILVILGVMLRGDIKLGPGAVAVEPLGRSGHVDPDDSLILVPVAMALGAGVPLIIAAAVSAPLAAIYFLIRFRAVLH